MRKLGFRAFIGGIIFAIVPIMVLVIAIVTAVMNGCRLDEAATYSCLIGGVDMGGLLGLMAMSGWLALVSVPLGSLVALVGLGVYVVARVMQSRRAAAAPAPVVEEPVEIIAPGEQL